MFKRSLKSLCCEKPLKICEIVSALFCCWNRLVSYFDKSMNTLIKSEWQKLREEVREKTSELQKKKQWYSEGRKLKMKVKEIYEASKAGSDAAGGREFIALLFPLVSYSTLLSPRSSPLLLFTAVNTSNMSGKTGLQTLANSWQNLNILSTSKWTTGWAGQYVFVLSGWFQGPNYL